MLSNVLDSSVAWDDCAGGNLDSLDMDRLGGVLDYPSFPAIRSKTSRNFGA
jgi:hypothetical protein